MTYRENYERWLSSDKVDEATKAELRAIADNDEEIRFRFVKDLEFGTGGLRGTMMAGTNAMNVYTVAHATQGLSDLINKEGKAEMGVAVGCDSRNNSRLFAETAARVLAANGIKVHLFPEIRCPRASLHSGHKHHRVPQPEAVQRLQGVLGRRRAAPA